MDITGRLTADAQVRSVQGDRKVVNFSVAVNDSYKNRQGERVTLTEFFDCSYWLSTTVADILKKGAIVELQGRVSTRAWLTKEGEPKSALNFYTSKIKLHSAAIKNNPEKGIANKEVSATVVTPEGDDLPF